MCAGLVCVIERVVGEGLVDDVVVLVGGVVVVVITSCLPNTLTVPLPSEGLVFCHILRLRTILTLTGHQTDSSNNQ